MVPKDAHVRADDEPDPGGKRDQRAEAAGEPGAAAHQDQPAEGGYRARKDVEPQPTRGPLPVLIRPEDEVEVRANERDQPAPDTGDQDDQPGNSCRDVTHKMPAPLQEANT